MTSEIIPVAVPCGQAALSAKIQALCVPTAQTTERFFLKR